MAKLTESYLRGMIKQVMNEMHDIAAINNAANEYDLGGFDSIEETAKRLGVNPMKLKAFIEQEQAGASAMYDEMGGDPNDYLAERKRLLSNSRTAPRRKILKEEFSQQENEILTQARNLGKPDFANAIADYLRTKDPTKSRQLSVKLHGATVGKKDIYDVYRKALEVKGEKPNKYYASGLDFAPPHPYDVALPGYEGRYKY